MNQNNILAKLIETTSTEEFITGFRNESNSILTGTVTYEKVYSIWICTAPPKYLSNSINSLEL